MSASSCLNALPALNAALNTLCAVLLMTGLFWIKRGRVREHRACMLAACAVSALFFASYLTYHYTHGTTRFQGQGILRTVYFAILLSHTFLAVWVPPLVGVLLYRVNRKDWEGHYRLARWVFPVWLYVSVTGVLIYWMLRLGS